MNVFISLYLISCVVITAQAGSSTCDVGQHWYNIEGSSTWVSSGNAGVWALTSAGNIYYRVGTYIGSSYYSNYDGRNYGFSHSDGTSWVQVDGVLAQLDVGKDSVWGVTPASLVFYRTGITSSNPIGTGWVQVSGLAALQVSVSDVDGKVWAVGTDNLVYRRVGISDELPGGSSWEHVPDIVSVRYVDVGGAGVWATTVAGNIYYRIGSRKDSQGSGWQSVPSSETRQVVSGGDVVWGVQHSGSLWFRLGITTAQPTGTEWMYVPGSVTELSISSTNNALWVVTNSTLIYTRHQ